MEEHQLCQSPASCVSWKGLCRTSLPPETCHLPLGPQGQACSPRMQLGLEGSCWRSCGMFKALTARSRQPGLHVPDGDRHSGYRERCALKEISIC